MRKAGNWFSEISQVKFSGINIFGVQQETDHKNIYDVVEIQRKMVNGCFQIANNYINKGK